MPAPPLWPHQARARDAVLAAIRAGHRRILLQAPTGAGKTRIVEEVVRHHLRGELRCVVYTNRRLLVDQLSGVLADSGLPHGVRAAGDTRNPDALLQVGSIQTEGSRVVRRKIDTLHPATLVVVDEAHLLGGPEAAAILNRHADDGACLLGVTATPLDLGHLYEHLIVAAKMQELRDCGALVRAVHFAPDEPDPRRVPTARCGENLTAGQLKKLYPMTQPLFGRVFETFGRLNPEKKPTILFAAGVAESIWFAQEFSRAGVPAAHLDGERVWVDGEFHESGRGIRREVLDGSRAGDLKVLCNRFVLREGIDAPWLAHGILATTYGSLQSYLQSGGRLLRRAGGLEFITVQDHGGNYWRHGSLNADREWSLEDTGRIVSRLRIERLRERLDVTPYPCPKCQCVLTGRVCTFCGFELGVGRPPRRVVMSDDTLRAWHGEPVPPRRVERRPDTEKKWNAIYWSSRATSKRETFVERTWAQAEGDFVRKYGYWPPRDLPNMPRELNDFGRYVHDTPPDRLVGRAYQTQTGGES